MKKYLLYGMLLLQPVWLSAQYPNEPDKGPVKPFGSYYTKEFTAFDNFNGGGVMNNPGAATTFILAQSSLITIIQTYHWNNARWSTPGTIKLVHSNGTVFGPWAATGIVGYGGVANAFWNVSPNEIVPAGTYTIVDSNNATWSYNSQSQNKGFAKVVGKKM